MGCQHHDGEPQPRPPAGPGRRDRGADPACSSPPAVPTTRSPTTPSGGSTSATRPSTACSLMRARPRPPGRSGTGRRLTPAVALRTPGGRGRGGGPPAAAPGPRRHLRARPLDVDLLLVALAADLDPRFEQFFGYLNDDVTQAPAVGRRRPRALRNAAVLRRAGRASCCHGPLITGGLLVVEDPDRPLPGTGAAGARPRRRASAGR